MDGESMIIQRVSKEPVYWIVRCSIRSENVRLGMSAVVVAILDPYGKFGPTVCPKCGASDRYASRTVTNEKTGEFLNS
jgi:hypothetical protein